MAHGPDIATVVAARTGESAAVDRLVADCLPLVYTIVGRALEGHADVDDVVQDVLLRMLRNLGDVREPGAFRSWLVALTVRQVRERLHARRGSPEALLAEDLREPGADFTDLAITRLELSGQRRETAEATRWLDEDNRELLALWWLEAAGELTRDELVAGLGMTRQHAAVRVQRMKGQLETARVVVRALDATPACPDLHLFTLPWDGQPGPLWRKRIARHTRECRQCGSAWAGLIPSERLLAAKALVPAPAELTGQVADRSFPYGGGRPGGGHTRQPGRAGSGLTRRVLAAALSTTTAAAGGAAALLAFQRPDRPAAALIAAPTPSAASDVGRPGGPTGPVGPFTPIGRSPDVSAAVARPAVEPSATSGPRLFTARAARKKGVSVWKFTGVSAALADVRAGWYHNWAPTHNDLAVPSDVEFVPTIWGLPNVTDATLAQARREGGHLLGFHEPDKADQSDMSVAEAIDAWPRLAATGMRLGSPAVASGADAPGGWLDQFMSRAKERGLRVDFVTLHWYGSDFGDAAAGQFLHYVDTVHQRYGKPIWVTEFGLINVTGSPRYPTPAQEVAFIRNSTAGLEERPYVERYAWFALPAVGDSAPIGLYADGDSPTSAGEAYRAAG